MALAYPAPAEGLFAGPSVCWSSAYSNTPWDDINIISRLLGVYKAYRITATNRISPEHMPTGVSLLHLNPDTLHLVGERVLESLLCELKESGVGKRISNPLCVQQEDANIHGFHSARQYHESLAKEAGLCLEIICRIEQARNAFCSTCLAMRQSTTRRVGATWSELVIDGEINICVGLNWIGYGSERIVVFDVRDLKLAKYENDSIMGRAEKEIAEEIARTEERSQKKPRKLALRGEGEMVDLTSAFMRIRRNQTEKEALMCSAESIVETWVHTNRLWVSRVLLRPFGHVVVRVQRRICLLVAVVRTPPRCSNATGNMLWACELALHARRCMFLLTRLGMTFIPHQQTPELWLDRELGSSAARHAIADQLSLFIAHWDSHPAAKKLVCSIRDSDATQTLRGVLSEHRTRWFSHTFSILNISP
jgi:hypothetical protein